MEPLLGILREATNSVMPIVVSLTQNRTEELGTDIDILRRVERSRGDKMKTSFVPSSFREFVFKVHSKQLHEQDFHFFVHKSNSDRLICSNIL